MHFKNQIFLQRIESHISGFRFSVMCPLKVDAGKTKQYLELKEKLRKLDINLFLEETNHLNSELKNIEANSLIIENQIKGEQANLQSLIAEE